MGVLSKERPKKHGHPMYYKATPPKYTNEVIFGYLHAQPFMHTFLNARTCFDSLYIYSIQAWCAQTQKCMVKLLINFSIYATSA